MDQDEGSEVGGKKLSYVKTPSKFKPFITIHGYVLSNQIDWSKALLLRLVSKDFRSAEDVGEIIKAEWELEEDFDINRLNDHLNLFYIILKSKKDYNTIRTKAHWIIDDYFVAVRKITCNGYPEGKHVLVNYVRLWVRISHVPIDLLSIPSLQYIVQKVGKILEVDDKDHGYFNMNTTTVRLKIKVDVRKFLPEGSLIKVGDTFYDFIFRYEKLPKNFCTVCRILDHEMRKCINDPLALWKQVTSPKKFGHAVEGTEIQEYKGEEGKENEERDRKDKKVMVESKDFSIPSTLFELSFKRGRKGIVIREPSLEGRTSIIGKDKEVHEEVEVSEEELQELRKPATKKKPGC